MLPLGSGQSPRAVDGKEARALKLFMVADVATLLQVFRSGFLVV